MSSSSASGNIWTQRGAPQTGGGPQGPAGPTGPQGVAGPRGASILGYSGFPSSSFGNDGDFCIDTTAYVIYGPKASGTWPTSGVSIVGPTGATGAKGQTGNVGQTGQTGSQGPQGIAGSNGNTILSGSGQPGSGIGNAGDFYIDTAAAIIYGPKASSWPSTGTSIVGPQGAQGAQGVQGATGPQGASIKGDTGSQGPQGTTGASGTNGNTVLNGSGAPSTQGVNGDFYIDTANYRFYGPKLSNTWPGSYISLIGPTGATGATGNTGPQGQTGPQGLTGAAGTNGKDGNTVLYGTGSPSASLGVTGNFYIDTAASYIYGPKGVSTWPSGASIIGPQGVQGFSMQSGSGAPGSGNGNNGDLYIDTTNARLYGPKANGTWPSSYTLLVGPMGSTGATGSTGAQGQAGQVGPTGATGQAGANGNTVLYGSGAPLNSNGVDGNFYIDTVAHAIYGPRASGVWPSGISLIGPMGSTGAAGSNGSNGTAVRSGTGAPASALGVVGDFYIDTQAITLYGPKTGSGWGSATSLVGPQGMDNTDVSVADFTVGYPAVSEASVIITDANVTATSKLVYQLSGQANGKADDEVAMDSFAISAVPGSGQFTLNIRGLEGPIHDYFRLTYIVGV